MIVVNKNEGTKIPYTLRVNKITFNDELMLNVERYERDEANHIDVCADKFGNLVCGVVPGTAERYVAQIDIPARAYTVTEGELVESDMGDYTPLTKEAVEFNMDNCTLTLWAIE